MKQIIQISLLILLAISCGKSQKMLYTEEELKIIDSHVESAFGKWKNVIHEIISPDIHVDIYVIEPTETRNYYTLVTVGMGAHKMNVPPEYDSLEINRAELLITLPPDWDLENSDETYYWPIRWLKTIARIPVERDTWLGWGHTISNREYGEPFAENTELCAILVTMPYFLEEKYASCNLQNNDLVRFYQLVPLYENEMQYKLENGTEALEQYFSENFDIEMVVNINRKKLFEK